ncbi:hypothetical protein CKAH01_10034 [Colletotrichum kahawae]|uniref:Uncharacterized protein n=1 Tax=Colletotrichum kahawae TaxID=34407 RepID=A0AAE0CYB1_COLKA|nr:hypothetical protein CKAH01_10034 [Colletotrichum kahawae]
MAGWTPIHYLFHGGYLHGGSWTPEDLLGVLASYGDTVLLDLETKDREGYSSLQMAASWYSGSVVKKLLWLGASMDEFGAEPWEHPGNPIRFAIMQGNTSAFESLLPLYDNVNASDHLGLLMLSYTARYGREEMTEHLLNSGSFEIFPEYHRNDDQYWDGGSDIDDGSDEGDWEDEGLKEWTKENYDKYMEALRRHNRITVRCDDVDGELYDTFWDTERGVEFGH